MTDLSPAAQAVLDAGQQYATQAWSDATHQRFNLGIAAALRAAADHVEWPANVSLRIIASELDELS
jgi:hypothetical protein